MDGGDAAAASGEEVVFRKPKQRPKNARARPAADDGDAPADALGGGSEVVRLEKKQKANPLVVGTKKEGGKQSMQEVLAHGSDRRISQYDNKATATNEQDVERSRDAQSQYETAQKMWDDGKDVSADGSKVYRGQKAYRQYTGKAESFDSQVNSGAGPARAPVHYRATARFDYQPDICKDYKDTGYCGYGDACVFLHDRSDYKAGWQLEKDWEDEQRAKAHAAALDAFSESEGVGGGASSRDAKGAKAPDDNLPFACLICREPWHAKSAPVVTRCEHYFCEACALQHAAKTKRCFVCSENTGGIFNTSKALQERIDKMRAAAEVEESAEQDDASLLAEYEEAQKKARGYTGGWGIV